MERRGRCSVSLSLDLADREKVGFNIFTGKRKKEKGIRNSKEGRREEVVFDFDRGRRRDLVGRGEKRKRGRWKEARLKKKGRGFCRSHGVEDDLRVPVEKGERGKFAKKRKECSAYRVWEYGTGCGPTRSTFCRKNGVAKRGGGRTMTPERQRNNTLIILRGKKGEKKN